MNAEPDAISMDAAVAERRQSQDQESPGERFARKAAAFGIDAARIAAASAVIVPLFLIAFLTLDLPVGMFDGAARTAPLRPSNWLSVGALVMAVATLILIFAARRRGEEEAIKVAILSWAVAAGLTLIELSVLAPTLTADDFPAARFTGGFVFSWLVAQIIAAKIYDLTRGREWWRAPFYGATWGLYAQGVIYFPLVYAGTGAPWTNWLITDLMIMTGVAAVFLPIYYFMRRRIRPQQGLGGAEF